MLRLYGEKKTRRILRLCQEQIFALEKRFGIPSAAMNAILLQEIPQIDLLDLLADGAVLLYWHVYRLSGRAPRFGKRDSSTGYAQVFARTAIRSVNFAADAGIADYKELGLLTDHRLDSGNIRDVRMIWLMLHRNNDFNLLCAALTLMDAAQEMTGRIDFLSYSAEEWQLIFTRYNADARHITAYGREAYRRYTQAL
ncbi:MAG: hypothetical protein IJ157_04775 [Clostridia bacterium]|nr:hypothetical protein [Clostridia bacterium]